MDFLCAGGLTLRPGVQKDGTFDMLAREYADLLPGYRKLYAAELPSGIPDPRYLERLSSRIRAALSEHAIPGRIPRRLFAGLVPRYTEVSVLLEHRGFERGEPGGRLRPHGPRIC